MKKIILSSFLVFSFAGYVIYSRILNAPTPVVNNVVNIVKSSINIEDEDEDVGYEVIPPRPIVNVNTNTQNISTQPIKVIAKPISTPNTAPMPVIKPVAIGLYRDGKYTGNSVDASYGYIQVVATISGGKISDVNFLDYPQDRPESIKKNMRAMPILAREAISIQSSNVNSVSGATFTSDAYRESLASALAQAKN